MVAKTKTRAAGVARRGDRRRRNPSGAGWRAKGFRAGVSGRYSESSDAWRAAPGKPPRQVPGLGGFAAESGKYIEAHEYFLEGYNRGAKAREKKKNPGGGSVTAILRERYGVGPLEAPPYALVWSYERAASTIGKKQAAAQLSAINRQRERAGKMPAYLNAGAKRKKWLLVRHTDGSYEVSDRPKPQAYVVGGYSTYAAAEKAWSRLMKTGRAGNPAAERVVPWRHGRGGRVVIPRTILKKYRYLFGGKISPAALKLIKQAYGKIKNPGVGAFERCVKEVAARGSAYSPRGVCATAGRRKYGAKKFAGMAAAGKRRAARKRKNPVGAAAERYEFFHGREPGEIVEVTTKIHEHGVLSGIGKLISLRIAPVDGSGEVTISNFRGALLAQNEAGTQLFVEGGDQSVNLADFIGRRQAAHELETLGAVLEVVYSTQKDHLRPEDGGKGHYHHVFGKGGTRLPLMVYDVVNKLLKFSGGGYDLPEVGIRG